MTLNASDILLYAAALFVLFLTPGPVWLAMIARSLSGGFQAAWPLAVGVMVGDALWPFLAILGVTWVASTLAGAMIALRYVAAAMFLTLGVLLIRNAGKTISGDSRLTRPGMWAGFLAGVAVILGNPKAILFYMGVLPGFFDLRHVTAADIAVIVVISMLVPLVGNLIFALSVGRIRSVLTSPRALRRTNMLAGGLMIVVGLVIPFA